MRIQINEGRIIDPANKIDTAGNVYIADGKIISLFEAPDGFAPDKTIDASNKLVCPGLVDISARFREPGMEHKATIESEAMAAISAGVTAICYPPDTTPVVDTPAVLELIHHRASSSNIHIYPLGALTQALGGQRLAEMFTLKQAGCVGVSNAYHPVANTEVLRRAMEYAASCGMTVHIVGQDHYLCNNGVVHEGPISTRLGLPAIPETAETVAVGRALLLIEHTGVRAHFCRLSCAKSVEMIARAKASGLPVTADVSICHLHLTEMDVDGYNSLCHLRPPLRALRDREALLQGLANGMIDAVCSDHQPHDSDAKIAPFTETEPGASTIEVLLPLILDLVNKGHLSLNHALACLTINPAKIMDITAGNLNVGGRADIAIIDPQLNWTVENSKLKSAGKNTPFSGWEMTGKASQTLVNGKIVHNLAL